VTNDYGTFVYTYFFYLKQYAEYCVGILLSTFRRSQLMPACRSWASRASVSMQPMPTRWSRCSAISRTLILGFSW